MSSYVVGKEEFVKAAGLIRGFEESKSHPHGWFVAHVREWFNEAFEMNAKSVAEQYHDEEVYEDDLAYDSTFWKYREMGERIGMGYGELKKDELRKRLMQFFSSVLYQIENDEMHERVAALFFKCIAKFEPEDGDNDYWWGKIEI